MITIHDDDVVQVRRQWNSYDSGTVRAGDLRRLHWSDISGSIHNSHGRSPRPMVHAQVNCDRVEGLAYSHSCVHGPPPHRINVTIVAKDNRREVMQWAKEQADKSRCYGMKVQGKR